MSYLEDVKNGVETFKSKAIGGIVQAAIDGGETPQAILESMIAAMGVIGDRFAKGEIFVPEMLMAAKTMNAGVDVIRPLLAAGGSVSKGKCIIGTVAGDLHDIGKNLVRTMIESEGFDMIDLGVDVAIEKFTDAIKENPDVKIVACSALLTTMVPSMRATVEALKAFRTESGIPYKILVGGGCMTQELADEMGADGFGKDAGSGGAAARALV